MAKKKPKIAILGVAYKANVDDARETPATKMIKLALARKWQVKVNDPLVANYEYRLDSIDETLKNADAAVLVTEHDYYRNLDFKKYPIPLIFDTRNVLNKNQLHENSELVTLGIN